MDARRSALIWTPLFGKWVTQIMYSTASNVVYTSREGVSPLPLAGSRQRITKIQSSVYVNSKNVTLGLYRDRSVERIKGNQATFDNSQRNNLRSCVWFCVVVFGVVLVLISFYGGNLAFFYLVGEQA